MIMTYLKPMAIICCITFGSCLVGADIALAADSSIQSLSVTGKPNIILILTDDQGYGDMGRHGNPILKTPNMDRLYDESMRFTDFQVSPCCAPTRSALMTGMHEFKSGVTHTILPYRQMNPKSTTVAEVLKSAGYATGLFGKWHLGQDPEHRPDNRGFDVSLTAKDDNQRSHFNPTLLRNGKSVKKKGYRRQKPDVTAGVFF